MSKTSNISILNGKWEDHADSNDLKGNSRIAYCNKTVQNVSMWSTILRQPILMHIYAIAMEYQVGSTDWGHDLLAGCATNLGFCRSRDVLQHGSCVPRAAIFFWKPN